MEKALGLHILADLYEVEGEKIDRVEDVRELLEGAVRFAKLTKISSHYYQFKPYGATGVILLAESHMSIHTWPEYGIATLDIYTCGDKGKAFKALEYVISQLKPAKVEKFIHERGDLKKVERQLLKTP